MRIALVSTCALATPPKKYGGTELVVAELTKGLLSLGHDVTVYATGDSATCGSLRYHVPRPIWPPSELAELRHASFAWKDIANAMRRFDVVHVHHAAALPYHQLVDIPTALTVHHMRVDALVDHYNSYPEVAYVAISRRQAQLSPELTFARTIHHGLDPACYPAGEGRGDYVAFLGRFAPEKAPHLAIDAARAAGVRVLLGGNPHEIPVAQAYFEREMKPRLADSAHVTWCGELAHEPKVELLAGARALLFPLDWEEPFGLVMIEAMLVGTPVIAFARGSANEVVEDGVTGFLVHNAEEMAQRIRQLDRIDRVRCRMRAQERWSTGRMAREYAELYAHMTRRARRAGMLRRAEPRTALERAASRWDAGHPVAAEKAEHGAELG
jgi:glycosyltransferase involved in cell wall biosynthesis